VLYRTSVCNDEVKVSYDIFTEHLKTFTFIALSCSKSVKVKVLKSSILNGLKSVRQSKDPENTPFKVLVEHYHLETSDSHSFK